LINCLKALKTLDPPESVTVTNETGSKQCNDNHDDVALRTKILETPIHLDPATDYFTPSIEPRGFDITCFYYWIQKLRILD